MYDTKYEYNSLSVRIIEKLIDLNFSVCFFILWVNFGVN